MYGKQIELLTAREIAEIYAQHLPPIKGETSEARQLRAGIIEAHILFEIGQKIQKGTLKF